ncbi:MAG: UDP-glucose/GDP-mannose dehydrogenase family protein [Pseudomonadota bacterium]
MKIVFVGTGYVGLVSGVCFSEFGFTVTCVDKDKNKIAMLNSGVSPIYEPGLEDLMHSNVKAGRLFFTDNLHDALENADVVFIAVGTPSRYDDSFGYADLSYVFAAAEEIAKSSRKYILVVTKSTVPAGTGRKISQIIKEANPELEFDVASNPEFLREGSAIEDFMHPDRVVVGIESTRARELVSRLYNPLRIHNIPIVYTSIESAEVIKYAANSFLATKIAFINEMADLCEKLGADIQDVSLGMGLDKRIGKRFLEPGPGFGGSCFPKDTMALVKMAESAGSHSRIVDAVVLSNDLRKYRMAEKIVEACGGSAHKKTIAILGLTFKPGTDDMRDSASLIIVPELLNARANVKVYDPQGMEEAKKLLTGEIEWCESAYAAMENADALVIITEWNEFMRLDLDKIKATLKTPVVVDLRNIYKPVEMQEAGIKYVSIGRQSKKA